MTMSEYEERFRPPVPSLHQTFTEVRGPIGEEGGIDAFGLGRP